MEPQSATELSEHGGPPGEEIYEGGGGGVYAARGTGRDAVPLLRRSHAGQPRASEGHALAALSGLERENGMPEEPEQRNYEAAWEAGIPLRSGGGGIRTHGRPFGRQRFSRPPRSTAPAPRLLQLSQRLRLAPRA